MNRTNLLPVLTIGVLILAFGCVSVKKNELYITTPNPIDTVFFASGEIYHDYLTSEAWNTVADDCIGVEAIPEAAYRGSLGMHITWDKISGECPWLGVGFGWDNWTGKDLSAIKNIAALEFYVRMKEGELINLPWAIGFEDFAGAQAWLGMSTNAIKAEKITTQWTRIELPLSEFNWDEQNADASNIKQVLFQLEADGEIYMDEVRIVPYSGGFRKRANINRLAANQFTVDGLTDDDIWKTLPQTFGKNTVHLAVIDHFLCIAARVSDPDPLQNTRTGEDLHEGDAFEIAFSTDLNAPQKRQRYRSTDQHIGFALGDNITSYNWTKAAPLRTTIAAARKTANGYVFEAKIDLTEFGITTFETGKLYGLEIAVDHGTAAGRYRQDRWNDAANAGFFENPALWGELLVVPAENTSNAP
jgi:hypothetical protein